MSAMGNSSSLHTETNKEEESVFYHIINKLEIILEKAFLSLYLVLWK